jgi:DNA polymerase I-like protein with 3'-5' exonuclease and polymerase domains
MTDILTQLAAKIYNVPVDKVTAEQRKSAKEAAFMYVYGTSTKRLSEVLGNEPRR